MWKSLFNIVAYIWQLPQNIVGLILRLFFTQTNGLVYKDKTIRICDNFGNKHAICGISLGNTLILNKYPYNTRTWNCVKHEWGHSRQSLYLGPLYLFIIGIPSIIWAACYRYDSSNPNGYYEFFTEKWADKLGNVKR